MILNLRRIAYLGCSPASCQYRTAATAAKQKAGSKKPPPLIECRRAEFNLQSPLEADSKFKSVDLASQGWMHYKAKGDYFIIKPTVTEDDLRAARQEVGEFVSQNEITFDEQLLQNLRRDMNIEQLTEIQVKAIPKIHDSHHTLVAAETGCGKTLAYLLPIMQKVVELKRNPNCPGVQDRKLNSPLVVVLTPGRELASQIAGVAEQLTQGCDIKVKALLGGNTKQLMVNPDFQEVDVLVATMGALSKLVTTGIYRMDQVRFVVLDEADTLLDDTFSDKLCHFLKRFPFHKNHMQSESVVGTQMVLASATMPTNISDLLHKVIDVETIHDVVSDNLHKLLPHVEQKFLRMSKINRPPTLLSIVKSELSKKRPLIVFSNKSTTSDYVSMFLNNSGVNCLNLNGDMLMKIRVGRFEKFQNGECDVLSTTDVGSRGLDTTRARHVINFDFPLHVSDYIHRSGRIGRVGNASKCLVTNFISSRREIPVVQRIEHAARTGGLLPNVNANIKQLINRRIMQNMQKAGIALPQQEEPLTMEEQEARRLAHENEAF